MQHGTRLAWELGQGNKTAPAPACITANTVAAHRHVRRPAPRLHAALADRARRGVSVSFTFGQSSPFKPHFFSSILRSSGERVGYTHVTITSPVLSRSADRARGAECPGKAAEAARAWSEAAGRERLFKRECHGLKTTRTCALTHPKDVQRGKRKAAAAPTERDGALRGVRHG